MLSYLACYLHICTYSCVKLFFLQKIDLSYWLSFLFPQKCRRFDFGSTQKTGYMMIIFSLLWYLSYTHGQNMIKIKGQSYFELIHCFYLSRSRCWGYCWNIHWSSSSASVISSWYLCWIFPKEEDRGGKITLTRIQR